ncbi:hypothetical protein GOV09_00730 [Candidatus Woesearchaeota archaeon]|nr:hypothetical protein [Candidatus Woesearchaeota archaeon]
MENIIGKELHISLSRLDNLVRVGTVTFNKANIKSETDFISTLQKVMKDLDDGKYTVHDDTSVFARFDLSKQSVRLHKWSENTGIVMPCWNYFEN